ncbi:hypothetical protein [Dyella japonica]|uniref:Uncharacterized protein n=1 Tax=Dyella japonica TaxID=231455 RepID=A0ABV2JX15_9GAMM
MNSLRRWVIGLATLAASMQAGAVGRLVDLSVYDRTSQRELPVYRHDGRYYVAGQPGHRYQIQLRSQHGGRVLGVLSVDGVNVLSGDTADWSQTGYVLQAYEGTDILGWRKSLSEVADFVFADASRSYAARTDRPANVGVIGIALFLPRRMIRPLPMPGPISALPEPIANAPDAQSSQPAPAADAAMAESAARATAKTLDSGPIGTGHGERETSVVSYTDFERASSTPNETITLYYDTRERLVAQGVIPGDDRPPAGRPDPFPGHFVPDPR